MDHIKKVMVNTTDLMLTCAVCKNSENRMVKNQDVFKRFEKNFRKRHEKCGKK